MIGPTITALAEDRALIGTVLANVPDISREIIANLRLPLPIIQRRRQISMKYSLLKYSELGGDERDALIILVGLTICHRHMNSTVQLEKYNDARDKRKNYSTPGALEELTRDARLKSRKSFKRAYRYLIFAAHVRLGYFAVSAPVVDALLPLLINSSRNRSGQSTISKKALLAKLRDSFRGYRESEPDFLEHAARYLEHLSSNAAPLIGPALDRYARVPWGLPRRPPSMRRV